MSRPALHPLRFLAAVLLPCALLLTGCQTTRTSPEAGPKTETGPGCITDFNDQTDYVGPSPKLRYAQNFTVTSHRSYQVLTVNQPAPGLPPESYVLLRCGAPAPKLEGNLAGAQIVRTPVTSVYSGSTTHIPLLVDLNRADAITGVGNTKNINNPQVRERIAQNQVTDFSPNRSIDVEKVLTGKPDVYITGGVDDPAYAKIRQAGIPVVANAEWLESTPLGRAEWLVMMGALLNEGPQAEARFTEIERSYLEVKEKVSKAAPVMVLPGQMYQGQWYMPGGKSYMAALLADAGGSYAWRDTDTTGRVQLGFEDILAKGRDAEVWLLTKNVQSIGQLTGEDSRYGELAAAKSGRAWSNNKILNEYGGNDYWERGVTRPDLVLSDLAQILHPGTQTGHPIEFYRPLDR